MNLKPSTVCPHYHVVPANVYVVLELPTNASGTTLNPRTWTLKATAWHHERINLCQIL